MVEGIPTKRVGVLGRGYSIKYPLKTLKTKKIEELYNTREYL